MRLRIATATLLVSLALILITEFPAHGRISLPTADSSDVAAVAAQTLANSGSKEVIPVLRRMLNHPSIVVRYYAAYGLGKLGDKESIKALKDSLWLKENDTPDDLANPRLAIDDLGGRERFIYPFGGYRQMACWALRKLGDTSGDKRFIEILNDEKADVKKRLEAFSCLKQLVTEAAFDAMCKVAESDKIDFVSRGLWPNVSGGGLTPEQEMKLHQLGARNKNLPEEVRNRHQYYVKWTTFAAVLNAAKTAQDVKKMFLEEKDPAKLYNIVSDLAKEDFGEVEDWALGYVEDWFRKNKNHQPRDVGGQMLRVLGWRGSQKCLPVLETLLKDNDLALEIRAEAIIAINGIVRRCNPKGSYFVLDNFDPLSLVSIMERGPEDKSLLFEGYKLPREECMKKVLELLRKPIGKGLQQNGASARRVYIDTLLAWKCPELVDIAVATLDNADERSAYPTVGEACMILRKMDAKEKLPDVNKFYERTHYDNTGLVTYTMYLFGDKEIPKRLLAEARVFEPEKSRRFDGTYLRLLMYDDVECQKFFFDLLAKDAPGLEGALDFPWSGCIVDGETLNFPINLRLATPAFEKVLMNSRSNYRRATLVQQMSKYAEKEVEVRKVLERFAAHSMDVCDQARKLIPQLGDENFDVRKKTREELQKLGVDAVPAFEERQKYADLEIQQALKELAESYKDYNTGY